MFYAAFKNQLNSDSVFHVFYLWIILRFSPVGTRLLTGGQMIQMWHCPAIGSSVEFYLHDGRMTSSVDELPQWTQLWQCKPSTPVQQVTFSPDGLLFGTVGKVCHPSLAFCMYSISVMTNTLVLTLARPLHTPSFGVRSPDQSCYIWCKDLTLNIGDCVSVMIG